MLYNFVICNIHHRSQLTYHNVIINYLNGYYFNHHHQLTKALLIKVKHMIMNQEFKTHF
jgi:hypothetical protein